MQPTQPTSKPQEKKLLDQVRDHLRLKHYSYRTEETYVSWIKRFILFHGKRHPTVLSSAEVNRIIFQMHGISKTMTKLLYGSGLRLMECMRLRVKDIDFENRQIIVRDGKGENDRATVLPDRVIAELKRHLEDVRALHEKDLREGYGETNLPYAL